MKGKQDIILTTYPRATTQNVGDALITESFTKLMTDQFPTFQADVLFREESLDGFSKELNVFAPGFSVRDGAYPRLYALYEDLEKLNSFFPFGCSIQHGYPGAAIFDNYRYTESSLQNLRYLSSRFGPFPCRDQLIVNLLNKFDVPAEYSGDLALFDSNHIGSGIERPAEISSLVFTVQHRERYNTQAIKMLSLLGCAFPQAKKYVALHSKRNANSCRILEFAKNAGFVEVDLSGDADKLSFYDGVDLHVGYRLHGHIAFLRKRKPSVLIVEDTRSYGFSRTNGTSIGCFDAMDEKALMVNKDTPLKILSFLDSQLRSGFVDYFPVFEFIDRQYFEYIVPKVRKFGLEAGCVQGDEQS